MSGETAGRMLVAATCVLLGARAVVIRGPSGSGKSTLAWILINTPGPCRFARLVCDDQVFVQPRDERLLATPVPAIAGRIEVRGLGIVPIAFAPIAQVGLIADLTPAHEIARLPQREDLSAELAGTRLPRLAVPIASPLAAALVADAMSHLATGGDLYDFIAEST